MLSRIKKLLLQDFVRIVSWSSVSYFIKIVSQFVVSKVLAITIGPSGLAILGQVTNLVSIVQSVGSAGISIGVTKYVAEYANDEAEQRKIINNAFKLVFWTSAVCLLFIITSFRFIGDSFFGSRDYDTVIIVSGLTVFLFSINNIVIAVINGLKLFRLYVVINTLNSLLNLILALIFVYFWGLSGALISVVLTPGLLFFVSYFFVYKKTWLSFDFFSIKFDREILKKLSKFSLMAINNAIVGAIGQIVLRNIIIKNTSIAEAGLWDSMNKISSSYLLLLTTSIQVYFLPTLASITVAALVWKELLRANKLIIPIITIILFIVFCFREHIILLLFTKDFLPIKEFFGYQLMGDIIKISSWIFAYIMYARAMTRQLIITDNVFTATYILLSYFLIQEFNLKGVYIAYIINNVVYLLFICVFVRNYLFNKTK
jgi:O-antigen/teichoic acid export membrane protein